jgi:hypothetical protein
MQGAVMGFYFRNAEFNVYVCPNDPLGALNKAVDECVDAWLERIDDERDPGVLLLGEFELEPDHIESFGPTLKGDIKKVSQLVLGCFKYPYVCPHEIETVEWR